MKNQNSVFAVLSLIAVSALGIYYAISTNKTPTCINFKVSRTTKLMPVLQGIAQRTGMTSTRGNNEWASSETQMSYYPDQVDGDYMVLVCQEQARTKSWQHVAKQVEIEFENNATAVTAALQRNDREFKCKPNCDVGLSRPLDFEQLNRTLLAHQLLSGEHVNDSSR
ncbi:hypothetical protein [Stenotrophobium rhamnosiphilum]|uniref:Uncharacterized protein n=1 Tax=Stenotrophobium rhamnosiphilum TaxID=2029166 RepID=A0A2T5MH76_9GAMM|nr:hypothetical protein [Stenotrophobium rhamnosiphilum]PTU31938.1 hypothetical protein CJD38_04435 [Stenotrophobium rhamnosiphilum]